MIRALKGKFALFGVLILMYPLPAMADKNPTVEIGTPPSQPITMTLIKPRKLDPLAENMFLLIQQKSAWFEHCWNRTLETGASLQPTLVTKFRVTPKGHVHGVRFVGKGVGHDMVHSCIQSRLESAQFPYTKAVSVPLKIQMVFASEVESHSYLAATSNVSATSSNDNPATAPRTMVAGEITSSIETTVERSDSVLRMTR